MTNVPATPRREFSTGEAGSPLSPSEVDDGTYPETFRVGFIGPAVAEAGQVRGRLLADGSDPKELTEAFGRVTFYFRAPGGFTAELNSFR